MNLQFIKYSNIYYSLLLIFLTLMIHFFPFERASISPDDYSFYNTEFKGLMNFLIHSHRPFQYIWFEIQNILIGLNGTFGLYYLYLANIFLILSIYFLYIQFSLNKTEAFIFSFIYLILINKIEIYHYPYVIHIILSSTAYIISLIFFIQYLNSLKIYKYLFSFIFFTIGIFWYENGFFISFIFLYLCLNKKQINNKLLFKILLPIFILQIFYIIYRLTGGFGFNDYFSGRQIRLEFIYQSLIDIFNNLIGRTFLRIFIYGLYNFIKINFIYLLILIIVDILIIYIFIKNVKKIFPSKMNKLNFRFFIFLFLLTLIPSILSGNVGPRSMILSLIGFVPILFFILNKIYYKNFLLVIIVSFFIIISQGNNWTQIISSRINYETFKTFKLIKDDLISKKIIIFDKSSFVNNIPYSFFSSDYNILHTYYGAQTFEDWGILSMINIATNNKINTNNLFIISEPPKITDKNKLTLIVYKPSAYKTISKDKFIVNTNESIIIDFDTVYPYGFNN